MADVEYYGVPPSEVRNVESRYRYLAASGQTDFAANYEVGFVDVYKNGVKLDPVTDFTATDLVKITLSVGATLNDKIQIITRRQIPLANALAKSGDVATGTITLPSPILTGVPVAPTAVAGTATTQVATTAFATAALQAVYPVGSIYINAAVATNPSTLFGFGTWTLFGAGKVLVGLDSADTTFNTLGGTGGTKDSAVVAHTHSATLSGTAASAGDHTHGISDPGHYHTYNNTIVGGSVYTDHGGNDTPQGYNYPNTSTSTTGITIVSGGAHSHTVSVSGTTDSTGSSATNGNLQPFVVVYMWNRTA